MKRKNSNSLSMIKRITHPEVDFLAIWITMLVFTICIVFIISVVVLALSSSKPFERYDSIYAECIQLEQYNAKTCHEIVLAIIED